MAELQSLWESANKVTWVVKSVRGNVVIHDNTCDSDMKNMPSVTIYEVWTREEQKTETITNSTTPNLNAAN